MWLTAAALATQAALIASNIGVARLSFLGQDDAPYDFPLLLGLVEACKLGISTVGALATRSEDRADVADSRRAATGAANSNAAHAQVDVNPLWIYLIPGVLYPLANSVDFLVVGIVTPGELSLLWNLKIASTAVLYRTILKRRLHIVQWIALSTLLAGVLLVVWAMQEASSQLTASSSHNDTTIQNGGTNGTAIGAGTVSDDSVIGSSQRVIALLFVLVGTVISSFASVATEWIFKRSRENIWRQNAKLYFVGILVFFFTVVMEEWIKWTNDGGDGDSSMAAGGNTSSSAMVAPAPSSSSFGRDRVGSGILPLFYGWNGFCVLLLVLKSGHGLFTSFLLKFFDVILTIHADALATVLNVVASVMFWGLEVDLVFASGALITLCSILVYHHVGEKVGAEKEELSSERELPSWSEYSPALAGETEEEVFSDIDLESEDMRDSEAEESMLLRK